MNWVLSRINWKRRYINLKDRRKFIKSYNLQSNKLNIFSTNKEKIKSSFLKNLSQHKLLPLYAELEQNQLPKNIFHLLCINSKVECMLIRRNCRTNMILFNRQERRLKAKLLWKLKKLFLTAYMNLKIHWFYQSVRVTVSFEILWETKKV